MMRKPAKRGRYTTHAESGTQLVELAIVLPVLLALLVAVAEFGLYFYTYTTLGKATRVGARFLSAQVYTDGQKTKTRNLVVCGSTSTCASGSAIVKNLTTANVTITRTGANVYFPETVTVQITGYTYRPIFDLSRFTGGASWQNVAVSPSTTMRYMLEN